MRQWIDVCDVTDVPKDTFKIIQVKNKSIGLIWDMGSIVALQNYCPHEGAEICRGKVRPRVIVGETGKPKYHCERRVIACPWHGWEFSITSGAPEFDARRPTLKLYKSRVFDGRVSILV